MEKQGSLRFFLVHSLMRSFCCGSIADLAASSMRSFLFGPMRSFCCSSIADLAWSRLQWCLAQALPILQRRDRNGFLHGPTRGFRYASIVDLVRECTAITNV
jgi:hypothetical protein